MRIVKKIGIGIGVLVVVFVLFMLWYSYAYRQLVVEGYEINSPQLKTKVLIATQGSDYKNAIVKAVTDKLGKEKIYIKVIDVTSLSQVNSQDYNAIAIISTIEKWKGHPEVVKFVNTVKNKDKLVMLTTSGDGSMKDSRISVDTMTSASPINMVEEHSRELIKLIKAEI